MKNNACERDNFPFLVPDLGLLQKDRLVHHFFYKSADGLRKDFSGKLLFVLLLKFDFEVIIRCVLRLQKLGTVFRSFIDSWHASFDVDWVRDGNYSISVQNFRIIKIIFLSISIKFQSLSWTGIFTKNNKTLPAVLERKNGYFFFPIMGNFSFYFSIVYQQLLNLSGKAVYCLKENNLCYQMRVFSYSLKKSIRQKKSFS